MSSKSYKQFMQALNTWYEKNLDSSCDWNDTDELYGAAFGAARKAYEATAAAC